MRKIFLFAVVIMLIVSNIYATDDLYVVIEELTTALEETHARLQESTAQIEILTEINDDLQKQVDTLSTALEETHARLQESNEVITSLTHELEVSDALLHEAQRKIDMSRFLLMVGGAYPLSVETILGVRIRNFYLYGSLLYPFRYHVGIGYRF